MDALADGEAIKDNEELRAMQYSYATNMAQSAFDAQVAKSMGQYQNALGQSNMTHAANLEMRNNASMMEQEFNYGMHSMGAQFDFQNEFRKRFSLEYMFIP